MNTNERNALTKRLRVITDRLEKQGDAQGAVDIRTVAKLAQSFDVNDKVRRTDCKGRHIGPIGTVKDLRHNGVSAYIAWPHGLGEWIPSSDLTLA